MDRSVVDAKAAAALRQAWPTILALIQVAVLVMIAGVLYWLTVVKWLHWFAVPPVFLWAAFLGVFAGGMAFGRWYWSDVETHR